jgi:hypothetical protein
MKIEKLLQLAEVTFRKQSNLDSLQSPNVLWCVHAREHYLHVLYPVSQVRFTAKLKERNILARLHYKLVANHSQLCRIETIPATSLEVTRVRNKEKTNQPRPPSAGRKVVPRASTL